jgi:hypothetical protein
LFLRRRLRGSNYYDLVRIHSWAVSKASLGYVLPFGAAATAIRFGRTDATFHAFLFKAICVSPTTGLRSQWRLVTAEGSRTGREEIVRCSQSSPSPVNLRQADRLPLYLAPYAPGSGRSDPLIQASRCQAWKPSDRRISWYFSAAT